MITLYMNDTFDFSLDPLVPQIFGNKFQMFQLYPSLQKLYNQDNSKVKQIKNLEAYLI